MEERKRRVLFICVHNSARSQMAEAFLKHLAGDRFEVESAGLEPGILNPDAVEVMKEVGLDISRNRTKSVFELLKAGRSYDYVITVCDESRAGECPIFPGPAASRCHWTFDDPSAFEGTGAEKLEKTRIVREAIRERLERWLGEIGGRG
ncbi:MAG TPA: arsenate reductase ArsC [bacterium]|nr:arsenate reductase ArsC [bacterium]HNS48302.1 arsenate reductase ArsC [bacterium]